MRRNTQRLYESIMKVVDRSVRKALNEQMANDNNADFIYNKILNDENVSAQEIDYLDTLTSVVRITKKDDLRKVIEFYSDYYPTHSLNWVDVYNICDMSYLFMDTNFNGDISKWDVSNVTNMEFMFNGSMFNGDISKWNVSCVINMNNMFFGSKFNGNISRWNVSHVAFMSEMFSESQFNRDISNWNVSNVEDMTAMFAGSQFNQNISNWNTYNVMSHEEAFYRCPIRREFKPRFDD